MLGAFIGDMVGKPYEFNPINSKEFPLFTKKCTFTDDTVCTAAICEWLLDGAEEDPSVHLRKWCSRYVYRGYGNYFAKWVKDTSIGPYNSWGNGSAMRVSPVGYFARDKKEVLELARMSAEPTHGHPDAVAGAQATALTIFRAIRKTNKEDILSEIREDFGYKLDRTIDEIRPNYKFYVDCKRTVPPSILAAAEASSFEDAIRNAISLGGDSDTMGAITGSIAEPMFGIPEDIAAEGIIRLPDDMRELLVRFAKEMTK